MSMRKVVLTSVLCFASLGAGGEIYKWLDENGRTQYSSTVPAGRPYRVLQPASEPSSEEQRRAQERLKQEMQQVESMREARTKATETADKESRERAEREARCQEAQLQIRFLEETQGLRWIEPGKPDGDIVHWLTDEEKEKVVQDWRVEARQVCESSGRIADQPPMQPGVVAPPPIRKPRQLPTK